MLQFRFLADMLVTDPTGCPTPASNMTAGSYLTELPKDYILEVYAGCALLPVSAVSALSASRLCPAVLLDAVLHLALPSVSFSLSLDRVGHPPPAAIPIAVDATPGWVLCLQCVRPDFRVGLRVG